MADYTMTEEQWEKINSALLTAIGVTSVHAREVHAQMLAASNVMDDIVNGSDGSVEEYADGRDFSYPYEP